MTRDALTGAAAVRCGRNQPNVYTSRSGHAVRATVRLLKGPWVDIWAAGTKNPVRVDSEMPEATIRSAHVELTGPAKGAWSAELSNAQDWAAVGRPQPVDVALQAKTSLLGRLDRVDISVGVTTGRRPDGDGGQPKQLFRLQLMPQRGASALFLPVNGSGDWCTVTLARGPWLSVWAVLNPSPMVLRPVPGGDTVKFWTTRFQMVGPDDQDWAADLDPGELWQPDLSFPM
ncbi:MAG: hypothetical protein QOJ19_1957 [Acidimicrobiia bacterium]|jgi:hypothetical protein|nr:hypothetical protein [Acidimicrobiia bacterium]